MKKIQDQYFIIKKPLADEYPNLKVDKAFARTRFKISMPSPEDGTLKFTNMWRDDNHRDNITETIEDVLFNGVYFLIRDNLYQKFHKKKLYKTGYYPAVYIDDQDQWHEDYWFVTVLNELDCWCRKNSDYDAKNVFFDGSCSINKIVLDEEIINSIPLEERKIFKLGKSMPSRILVHESLANIILSANVTPECLIPLSDYR